MSETAYDSAPDTQAHIERVQHFMDLAIENLKDRAIVHDSSKLIPPEKEAFDEYTPMLSNLQYGSDEYRETLRKMKPALKHHYEHNSHHPEHYENGIEGMSLMDILEMLCDWRAASERTKQRMDGDTYLKKSFAEGLQYNAGRFSIDHQLQCVIENTARELGLID